MSLDAKLINTKVPMGMISPFGKGGEYLTFLFHKDDEEHLVPRSLFAKSHSIKPDHNNHVYIENIASTTFSHLTSYLIGNHEELNAEKVSAMIDAAKVLGLLEIVKELSSFFNLEG